MARSTARNRTGKNTDRTTRSADDLVTEFGLTDTPRTAGRRDPVQAHILAGIDTRLRALVAHDPGTRLGEDPEELHQMRVSVRRMRAMLKSGSAFVDPDWAKPLRTELGWLAGALGAVRDLDVLLERLRAESEDLPEHEKSSAEKLVSGLEQERTAARRELLKALRGKRYRELLRSLTEAANARVAEHPDADGRKELRDLVRAEFSTLHEHVRDAGPDAEDEVMHDLRIRGKRLRYTAELAEHTFGKSARRLLKAAKQFQDVLGEHQDAVVAAGRVRQLLGEHTGRGKSELAFVAGRLVEREHLRRNECRDQWWSTWKSLRKAAEQI